MSRRNRGVNRRADEQSEQQRRPDDLQVRQGLSAGGDQFRSGGTMKGFRMQTERTCRLQFADSLKSTLRFVTD